MAQTLARIIQCARTKKEPEYLPPYFWHRYTVWYGLIYFLLYWGSLRLLDVIVPVDEATSTLRSFALSFARMALVWGMPLYLRKRWVVKELTRLEQKITATLERGSSRSIEIPEATKKLSYFRDDLQAYLRPSSLSIRRTPWSGEGTRYTLYRRGKPKRVVTFSMTRYHFEIEKRAGALECSRAVPRVASIMWGVTRQQLDSHEPFSFSDAKVSDPPNKLSGRANISAESCSLWYANASISFVSQAALTAFQKGLSSSSNP